MTCYATITGTLRNLAELRRNGWRLLLTPDTHAKSLKPRPGFRFALDNGAWGCFQRGAPFNEAGFLSLLEAYGDRADWLVMPDQVAAGRDSLIMSRWWMWRLAELEADGLKLPRLRLLAVQDGMEPDDVAPLLGPDVGLFLGGSTEWKLATMYRWGTLASQVGCYYHVARVNSARRIAMACRAGADSFDGTSATRFAVNAEPLADAAALYAADPQADMFTRGGWDG